MSSNLYSKVFLAVFFSLCSVLAFGQYCTPVHNNLCTTAANADVIASFSTTGGISNITNLNTNCSGNPSNYTYYSNMTHSTFPGSVVNFQFITTSAQWDDGYRIWVDWDQNFVFDPVTELVYNSVTTVPGFGTVVNSSFTVPLTAVIGTTRLRIRCVFNTANFPPCSTVNWGEAEDYNFEVISPTPCSGMPTPVAVASSTALCAPGSVSISTTGLAASGFTYQWQSTIACFSNWTNISGATGPNYSVNSVGLPTSYRVIVTCTNSAMTATSNAVTLYNACYCSSTATSTVNSDIGYVEIGSFSNPAAPPATFMNNPASAATYTYHGSVPPIDLEPGALYPVTISQINSGNYGQGYLKLYIDYNKDGSFTGAGEEVFAAAGPPNAAALTFQGSFAVPATAAPGYTRMRIVLRDAGSAATTTSCGTYTFGETEDYDVFIHPNWPAPNATVTNPVICEGQNINLFASASAQCFVFSWTGPNGFSSSAGNPVITNATAAASGIYSVVVSSYGISSAADTVHVTVNPATTSTASATICPGGSITFGPNTITAAGSYTHTFTTSSGCDSTVTLNVTVTPTPVIGSVTPSNPTTCAGSDGSLTLSGMTPGVTYTISYAQNSIPQPQLSQVASAAGTLTIGSLAAGNYNAITVAQGSCASAPAGPVTLVDPTPPAAPVAGNNGPLCTGATLDLTATPVAGATYTWTGPASFNSTLQNPSITNVQAIHAGPYSVTATTNGCTSAASTTTVIVNPTPAAPAAGSNSPVCAGSSINLTASTIAGATYTWTGPGPFNSASQNPVVPNAAPANAGSYSVTATVGNCTSPAATTVVAVNPVPVIGAITSVNPTACGSSTGSITITGLTAGTSYIINYAKNSLPQPAVTQTATAAGSVTLSSLTAGSYTNITVTVNGCASAPAGPVGLVDPNPPAAPVAGNNGPLCAGAALNLTATTVPGATYTWTGPASFGSPGQNPSITNAQVINSGTYSVTATVNGCTSPAATTPVVINPIPAVPVATNNGPICAGGTLNLSASTVPGASYTWTGPATFNATTQNPSITNTQVVNAGTYSVIASANGCSSAAGTTTVVVVPQAAAPAANSNSPVCAGSTLSLSTPSVPGATYSWTGPNSFTAFTSNPSIATPTTAASGTYTVTVTLNGCPSAAGTTSVTVHPIPAIPTASNVIYCQFATATPLTATGQNLLWYTTAVGGTGTSIAPLPNTSALGTTTWYVSQTVNGCESARAAVSVTVLTKPAAPVGNNETYCQGYPASPLTATGQGLLWYTTPTGGVGSATAPVPSTATVGTFTWYVSQSINNCESDRSPVTVTILTTPPLPGVMTPVNYCQFSPANPPLSTVVSGNNVLWYTSATGGTGSSSAPVIDTSVAGTTTYYVSQMLGSCESARTPVVVNVIAKPQPPAIANLTYCQFATAPALTATGQNLLWYTSAVGGTGSAVAPVPATTTVGTTTWYVSQTVGGCESDRNPITVTVILEPILPAATTSYTYCQFDSAAQLTAAGQNIKWYNTAVGGNPFTNAPTPATTIPGTYDWYVTQTINGCESDRLQITVVVIDKPDTPIVSNPLLFCEGDSSALIVIQGADLKWYTAPTGGAPSSVTPLVDIDTPGTAYHYVSQTVNGCESDRALVVVTVNPRVTADIDISKDIFCQYDTVLLENVGVNPVTASYAWNFDAGSVIAGSGSGPYQITWDVPGIKTISVTVSNLNCSDSDRISVTVKPSPDAFFDIKPHACIGEVVLVQAAFNSMNSHHYNWDFADADILDGTGAGYYKLRWSVAGEKTITLQSTLNGCRSKLNTDTIVVHEVPFARINPLDNTDICSGDTIDFRAENNPGTVYNYLWSPARFFVYNGQQMATGIVQTSGFIKLQVVDPYGCAGADSLYITTRPCCSIALPDAFTPNGDGRNDKFKIITDGHHQISTFRVVNRYGQTVFETATETQGWDGTINGVQQPVGTYFYYVRYRCDGENTFEKKGEVILVR